MKKFSMYNFRRMAAGVILACMALSVALPLTAMAETISVNDLLGTGGGNTSSSQNVTGGNTSGNAVQNTPSAGTGTAVAGSQGTETKGNVANTAPSASTGTQGGSSGGLVGGISSADGGADVYNQLAESSKVDLNNPKAAQATSGLQRVVGIVVCVLCYAIVIFMSLRVVLDLFYVTVPFTRKFLCASAQQSPSAQAGGAMGGMGSMGGMGGYGGYGGGGFGGGYGSGYGGGYGGMGGYGAGGIGTGAQGGPGGPGEGAGGIQWVSKAALNAVMNEGQLNPKTGKAMNAFSIYAKDMIVVLIIVPVLLVLATNGMLVTLGFKIAGVVSSLIGKVSGNL